MHQQRKKRPRSWVEISASILYSASGSSITKTKIMLYASISYEQAIKYVSDLLGGGLLMAVDLPPRHFRTTEKGYEFLKAYEKVQELTPSICRRE